MFAMFVIILTINFIEYFQKKAVDILKKLVN